MTRKKTIPIMIHAVLFSAIAPCSWANVATRSSDTTTPVLRLSDLRAAYLVRAEAARYDPRATSPDELRHQLQGHFDVVLALLATSTDESIRTALDRLERASGERWSDATRDRWARQLLARRLTQLLRLKAYRDRGQFPHNNRYARPTPIFVDAWNTACAVGHLMRLDGRNQEVATIRANTNLVYVTDVVAGPVLHWVLTSGLTIEEAALIQPAYPNIPSQLPPIPMHAAHPMEAGWSGAFDDLRFSNFRFYQPGDQAPSVNVDLTHSFCNSYACSILPRIEDYGGHVEHYGWFELLPEGFNDFERVVVQFDVETLLPSQRIAGHPTGRTAYTRSLQPIYGQKNDILLFAGTTKEQVYIDDVLQREFATIEPFPARDSGSSPAIPLQVVSWESADASDQFDLPLKRRMNVVTEMLLQADQLYQAQLLSFSVITVPEPSSIITTIMALALIGVRTRRGKGVRS